MSEQILEALEFIRDQRAKIMLEPGSPEMGVVLKDATATLVNFSSRGIALEVSALKVASSAWVGAVVSCYFRLRDWKGQGGDQLYTFSSRILLVRAPPGGVVQLVLDMPESIRDGQRRRSVRVAVDPCKVPVLQCWRELPSGTRVTHKAPLLDMEADARRGLRLVNLSACGLRLLVPNPLLHKALPEQIKGEVFTFHFQAAGESAKSPVSVWVNAALRNISIHQQKDEVSLGFEFVAEGTLDQNRRITWQSLKLEEVGRLGKLIFKWNLEACREKDGVGG